MTFLGPPLYCFQSYLQIEGECYTGVIDMLNKELKSICLWLKSNKLTLNVKKITLHDVSERELKRDVII